MVARGREQIMSGGRGVAAMRWHADAGERCEVCLSCNVPIMFRWTKRDGPAGCVCSCPWCRAVPRRAVRMDYRSISVASVKIIKAPPFLFRIAGSRSSPRTQFAASTTTHISGTRHGSRELENISMARNITAPVSSPRRTRARSPPRRFRDPLAIPRSLMAISHSTHGRLTQRPLHTGWTLQLSGSLPRPH